MEKRTRLDRAKIRLAINGLKATGGFAGKAAEWVGVTPRGMRVWASKYPEIVAHYNGEARLKREGQLAIRKNRLKLPEHLRK
jgi:hypothetical protein